ncbi:Beta-glucanase, GH16 family [Metschnikowia aff. pulcherrima]|uniref:Beta-glucanase, GH16 family n=1 Tax=Metschnikowia aff. pulcherrima TaxID=2163413 RepID=A0A4V1ADP0_9ASCO|nr:Beta-glucanase, GH16 family [Metschnikowia aff. pulcherrima]
MVSKVVAVCVALISLTAKVQAETWTEIPCNTTSQCPEDNPCCSQYGMCGTGWYCLGGCDPRSSYNLTACMPQPRMSSFTDPLSDASKILNVEQYLGNASEANWVYTGHVDSKDEATLLQMPKDSTGSVISSTKYLWYGRVGASLKSSRDKGVITAFIMFSDVQDEIDLEFTGSDLSFPQTNFYSKGALNYTNTGRFEVTNTFENWHYYEMDWQEDQIRWFVDGKIVRTLERASTWSDKSKKFEFPSTPSRIQFSIWPAQAALGGLTDWAGGSIDWESDDIKNVGYYYAYVKNVSVQAYALPSLIDQRMTNISGDHAFLYESADGNEDNVYLTKAKTWLGSSDASGLNPDNEDKKPSASVVQPKSSNSTIISTPEKTKAPKAQSTSTDSVSVAPSSTLEVYSGGFVQNLNSSSPPSTSSSMPPASGARSQNQDVLWSVSIAVCAIVGGLFYTIY